jgi:addiction module HigA family antidote
MKPLPTHPGEILKDELDYRGITQKEFSKKARLHVSLLNEVLKGKRKVSIMMALKIEKAIGVDAEYWLNSQMHYDLAMYKRKKRIR